MRSCLLCFFFLTISSITYGQKPTEILATANGRNFSVADLSPDLQEALVNEPKVMAATRTQLLSKLIADNLLNLEAKEKGVTVESLVNAARAKAVGPTEEEIKEAYDANRAALSDRSPADARKALIEFLRREPEEAALSKYVETLSQKYKPVMGKSINAIGLVPSDIILTIGAHSFAAKDFDNKYKLALYDTKCDFVDALRSSTDDAVYLYLVAAEAKAQNIESAEVIAREVTNKMKDFSDEERTSLENGFKKRLFAKYDVKFFIKDPPPIVQNIAVGDAPSRGNAGAPVTIVMFSDFQCPACSATHPILQKVMTEYGDKVHFVVRDFPLTTLHPNAFRAALAAYAANVQGKFFEYTDLLYKNQSALDDASLSRYAASLGLNVKRFELDLSSENAAAAVKKDMADGESYGITGTPTIFINGIATRYLSADSFRQAIDAALKNGNTALKR